MIELGIIGINCESTIRSLSEEFCVASTELYKLKDPIDELAESLLKAHNQMERSLKSNNWLKMHGKPLRRGKRKLGDETVNRKGCDLYQITG